MSKQIVLKKQMKLANKRKGPKRAKKIAKRNAVALRRAQGNIAKAVLGGTTNRALKQYRTVLNDVEKKYIRCVMRPDLYEAKIPGMFPIPSSVCQTKGVTTFAVNNNGAAGCFLDPGSPGYIFCLLAGDTFTENQAWNIAANARTIVPSHKDKSLRRRTVGAYAKITCLEPNLTRKGQMVGAVLPYDPTIVAPSAAGFNFDVLRDQPNSRTINLCDETELFGRYVPFDPSDLMFAHHTSAAGQARIVFCITGAPAGARFSVEYRIVHEIVPDYAFTDLLMPTADAQGRAEVSVSAASHAPSVHTRQEANSGFHAEPSFIEVVEQSFADVGRSFLSALHLGHNDESTAPY